MPRVATTVVHFRQPHLRAGKLLSVFCSTEGPISMPRVAATVMHLGQPRLRAAKLLSVFF